MAQVKDLIAFDDLVLIRRTRDVVVGIDGLFIPWIELDRAEFLQLTNDDIVYDPSYICSDMGLQFKPTWGGRIQTRIPFVVCSERCLNGGGLAVHFG